MATVKLNYQLKAVFNRKGVLLFDDLSGNLKGFELTFFAKYNDLFKYVWDYLVDVFEDFCNNAADYLKKVVQYFINFLLSVFYQIVFFFWRNFVHVLARLANLYGLSVNWHILNEQINIPYESLVPLIPKRFNFKVSNGINFLMKFDTSSSTQDYRVYFSELSLVWGFNFVSKDSKVYFEKPSLVSFKFSNFVILVVDYNIFEAKNYLVSFDLAGNEFNDETLGFIIRELRNALLKPFLKQVCFRFKEFIISWIELTINQMRQAVLLGNLRNLLIEISEILKRDIKSGGKPRSHGSHQFQFSNRSRRELQMLFDFNLIDKNIRLMIANIFVIEFKLKNACEIKIPVEMQGRFVLEFKEHNKEMYEELLQKELLPTTSLFDGLISLPSIFFNFSTRKPKKTLKEELVHRL